MSEAIATAPAAENIATPESNAESVSQSQTAEGKNASGHETKQEAPRKLKVKIDGEEVEKTEDELIRDYQLKQASYKRMADASKEKKEAEGIKKLWAENPEEALEQLAKSGKNVRDSVEKWLAKKLREEMESPEEKEKRELREYKERNESEAKKKAEDEKRQKDEEEDNRVAAEIQTNMMKAIEKAEIPKAPYVVKRVAQYMLAALQHDIDLTIEEAAQFVKEEDFNDAKGMFASLDGATILRILGDDIANKIREADLGRLKSTPTVPSKGPTKLEESPSRKESKPMTPEEWEAYINSVKAKSS